MYKFLFIVLLILLPFSVKAQEKVQGHIPPLQEELLPEPIYLQHGCSNYSVTEWRGSAITVQATSAIKEICAKVYRNFYPFVILRGYSPGLSNDTWTISLLPFRGKVGRAYRNLNDRVFRFKARQKFCQQLYCSANDSEVDLLGYTSFTNKIIFIRNDVLLDNKVNPSFQCDFAHEVFHSLSRSTGVQSQQKNWKVDDEELASKFAEELYGKRCNFTS